MMAVECARGVMEGVRICFSKDLRDFVSCPEVSRQYCRASSISVPPMH
jgi:ribonuclease T2